MKALFFSPYANIWDHSFPESLVAEALGTQGIDSTFVNCDGILQEFCIAMSASGLTAEASAKQRSQVCAACRKRRDFLSESFGGRRLLLEDFLTEEDLLRAKAISKNATHENWASIQLDDIPIGRYSAYEFLLNYKILGTNIPENLMNIYRGQLYNGVVSMLAASRILDEIKPEAVLTYNRLYSANHAFLAVAEKRGISTFSLQGGGHITHRAETMTMFKESQTQFQIFDSAGWKDYESSPIGAHEINLVASHFDGLLQASSAFAYSQAFEGTQPSVIRERFELDPGKPTILIPLSSEDELNAAQLADLIPDTSKRPNVFPDQFAWIQHALSFAGERPEYQFIVRLHPRMFPNKRESVVAPVLQLVNDLLKDVPPNVRINKPDDQVSLYDLMQITDVLLGYRSSVGAEFAAFGIPVVAPANKDFFTYPLSVQKTGYTVLEYEALIDLATAEGWSLEYVRAIYRWYAYLFTRIAADLSESVKSQPSAIRPKKPGVRLWLWRKMVFLIIQFGPLLRERIAVRNRVISSQFAAVMADTVKNSRNSIADSVEWPQETRTLVEETALLRRHLLNLTQTRWSDISDPHSLAERIRRALR